MTSRSPPFKTLLNELGFLFGIMPIARWNCIFRTTREREHRKKTPFQGILESCNEKKVDLCSCSRWIALKSSHSELFILWAPGILFPFILSICIKGSFSISVMYRGNHTLVQRYEFYILVEQIISHTLAALTHEVFLCDSEIKSISSLHRVISFTSKFLSIFCASLWLYNSLLSFCTFAYTVFSKLYFFTCNTFPT